MEANTCYHCGENCGHSPVGFDGRQFCCQGCKAVYEIFMSHDLSHYYDIQKEAGNSPVEASNKYNFLENEDIVSRLVDFDAEGIQVVNLMIPQIHCSSCIWVLENLKRLHPGIRASQVDFPGKSLQVTYAVDQCSLKDLVYLLARIGYPPNISLEDYEKKAKKVDRSLIYKLGVAGFAFGNVMLLSFPEYFEVEEFWLDQYKGFFRGLMLAFSLPVVFYAAQDYFKTAYRGLLSGILNIDVPIALGILVLFLRSTADILFNLGSGFFDSLTGLVFFLLVGKFFQQKTYAFLSFERDYKSYFPIAVASLTENGSEKNLEVEQIKPGDRLLIRNQEILPVDSLLLGGDARIDYSFVTGESQAVHKKSGDRLYAGGKQLGGPIEVEALKSVSQSYLTQLWSNAAFEKDKAGAFQNLTDAIGKRFTLTVLCIALMAAIYWLLMDPSKVMNVFTAVLIIACPCAIALAAPFTLGNILRIFGRQQFYVKDTNTLERLAAVDMAIFDKTGTLTSTCSDSIFYEGIPLNEDEGAVLKTTLRGSNHPLARSLYAILKANEIMTLDEFKERTGRGLEGRWGEQTIRAGSAEYAGHAVSDQNQATAVHIRANEDYKGRFVFKTNYRTGIGSMIHRLKKQLDVVVLSGDNDQERNYLERILPGETPMFFNQKPEEKLEFVKACQQKHRVLMVGDGLNDAGALAQSDVGIAVSENTNVFTPACDAILGAGKLVHLDTFMALTRQSITIIKMCFVLSLCYNLVGLYFAVTGQLMPVIAAILMPLSSISIVAFATLATNVIGKKLETMTGCEN